MIGHGTKSTGADVVDRQAFFWKCAADSMRLKSVYKIYVSNLIRKDLAGRSKRCSNIPRNGSTNARGSLMESPVTQGFCRLSIDGNQVKVILAQCRKLKRYLIPSEYQKVLRIPPFNKQITDLEEKTMQMTWLDFCREKDLDQKSSLSNVDILEAWFGYVSTHYHQPMPEISSGNPWGVTD